MNIPVYIINLKHRIDRKGFILQEFDNKKEFDIHLMEACNNPVGAIGLWKSIGKVLEEEIDTDSEFIIICEDDHQFTSAYSKERVFKCINEAKENHADIVLGGISGFTNAMKLSSNLFWVEKFSGTQFLIIFKKFFNAILHTDFTKNDSADYKMCSLTEKKFFIYPFISIQKDFGYSDATPKNNIKNRVKDLFSQSMIKLQLLEKVSSFYMNIDKMNLQDSYKTNWKKVTIPTYVINLPERIKRKQHIEEQFKDRPEFDVTIVEACRHKIGAMGLWLSIRKIVQMAIENEDDVIIICEDDHQFTKDFKKEDLFRAIITAQKYQADLLSGGTAILKTVLPVAPNLFWVNEYLSTQFIIVFKKFFQKILDEPFNDTVFADGLLSEMTANKLLLYPVISIQKNFGYSDCTELNDKHPERVQDFFKKSISRMEAIYNASLNCQCRSSS